MLAMNVLQGYKIIRSVRLEWGKNNYLSKTMRQRMQKMKAENAKNESVCAVCWNVTGRAWVNAMFPLLVVSASTSGKFKKSLAKLKHTYSHLTYLK